MAKGLLLVLLALCLELLLALALLAGQQLPTLLAAEPQWAQAWLGEAAAARVSQQARADFNRDFVHPGTVAASYAGASPGLIPYLDAAWDSLRQLYWRLAYGARWLPVLLARALPALLDGLWRRRLKRAEFRNLSPSLHRFSVYALLGGLCLSGLGLLLPLPLPPLWPLVLGGLFCLFLNLALANTQRRV
ncbi:MAG: DUF4400 domain-containing protein [Candidatus Competibacteraceae bacterium]